MADGQLNGTAAPNGDVEMKEEVLAEAPLSSISQAPEQLQAQPPAAASNFDHLPHLQPAPASTMSTPPPAIQPSVKPEKPVAHGGPTRQYLNQNVTPHLLEAMKYLAVYEPEKPLQWLADFLRDRSKEVEG